MAGELDGKVAIITGAAAGIGRAAALLFAREGARLLLSDIDEVTGRRTTADIVAAGGAAEFVKADVSCERDVIALVDAAQTIYSGFDLAFNNAGIGHTPVSLIDISLETWERFLRVNLTGVFLCMKHQIPRLLERGGGAIVNTGSVAGLAATPMMGAYSASKFGLIGITRSAAAEFANRNIRINAVCPTATDTPGMRDFLAAMDVDPAKMDGPMGRMGRPEEIAEVALWLLSDRASFVTGQTVSATGGSSGQTA